MTKRATPAIPLPADRLAAWRLARQRLDHDSPARGRVIGAPGPAEEA